MMAKIEWYQEVLEQEPGSRVFFPLARLLVQDGRGDEALAVLQNGLAQHTDFLEARLFLIQLLHEQGQSVACHAEVTRIATVFEAYPTFWDAWAESVAGVSRERELAMRFMSATFKNHKISLWDVFASGLSSFLRETEKRLEPVPPADNVSEQPLLPEEPPFPDLDVISELDTVIIPVSAPEAGSKTEQPISSDSNSDPLPLELVDAEFSAVLPTVAEQPELPEQSESSEQPEVWKPSEMPPPESAPLPDRPRRSDATAENSEQEEPTLRTRSMANVLAEQGDFAGALEIYQELEASAPSPEEAKVLHDRVVALVSRMSGEETPAPSMAAAKAATKAETVTAQETEDVTPPSQKKLMSLLEALADRLEARARA